MITIEASLSAKPVVDVTVKGIVHWVGDGITGPVCGAGARWSSAYIISNRDRDRVTCYGCRRTKAYRATN